MNPRIRLRNGSEKKGWTPAADHDSSLAGGQFTPDPRGIHGGRSHARRRALDEPVVARVVAAADRDGHARQSTDHSSAPETAETRPSHGSSSSGDTILNFSGAIRSIFSICNALRQEGLLTLPDVPPSVCYPSGRRWQRRGPKPGEQRNLDLRIGRERASRHDDCQHQGGRGPAVRGKVNPGEVLLKVVTKNKPKMLTGLNQKVSGQV